MTTPRSSSSTTSWIVVLMVDAIDRYAPPKHNSATITSAYVGASPIADDGHPVEQHRAAQQPGPGQPRRDRQQQRREQHRADARGAEQQPQTHARHAEDRLAVHRQVAEQRAAQPGHRDDRQAARQDRRAGDARGRHHAGCPASAPPRAARPRPSLVPRIDHQHADDHQERHRVDARTPPAAPHAAITMPARNGPSARAALNWALLSVTAFNSRSRGTSSVTNDCQIGRVHAAGQTRQRTPAPTSDAMVAEPGRHQGPQRERAHRLGHLGGDQEPAARVAVGQRAADQAHHHERHVLEEAGDADVARAARSA